MNKSAMHSKIDNMEIMISDKVDEVEEELFESLHTLEVSIKGSQFLFNYVHLLYYKCHNINSNCGGPKIGSAEWIRKKQQ